MYLNVHLKGGYSDRKNITNFRDIVQFEDLNERTKNKIYTLISGYIDFSENIFKKSEKLDGYNKFLEFMYEDLFSCTIEDVPAQINSYGSWVDLYEVKAQIKQFILTNGYNEILDLLEGINKFWKQRDNSFEEAINNIFKEENVQHRFVNGIITDIINEHEIKEIQESLDKNDDSSVHISKAINHLYNRQKPDYENSVKESICAVEVKCKEITKDPKATLGSAIKKLKDKGIIVHPSFEQGISKLYGYASDAKGIRHGGGKETTITEKEAKLVLTICTATCNYFDSYS